MRFLLIVSLFLSTTISHSYAEEKPSQPEGMYICLQNKNMNGSVWNPVQCKRFAEFEEQIIDNTGEPVVKFGHIEPNIAGGNNILWKVDFRGVGSPTDKTSHWFCSSRESGFVCIWQTTNNQEDWLMHNKLLDAGITDIPDAFFISNQLISSYLERKPVISMRKKNEIRYAKATALSKDEKFSWSYIPDTRGACRILGPTTPFKFIEAFAAKEHYSGIEWDSIVGDDNVESSTIAALTKPSKTDKDNSFAEYIFFTSTEACNTYLEKALPTGGIEVTEADLTHKPAKKWVITDGNAISAACHWPTSATSKSPKEFLSILKEQGARIFEVSKPEALSEIKGMPFEISFFYTLKGHANHISWSDLGDSSCDKHIKDKLKLP